MTNPSLSEIIAKLESWSLESSSFHADRQLSDEILIADGWQCEESADFEGGFRWWVGVNPQYSTGDNRPHPINDLNAAIGIVPFGAKFILEGCHATSKFTARVAGNNLSVFGHSTRATVALLIASLKYNRFFADDVEKRAGYATVLE